MIDHARIIKEIQWSMPTCVNCEHWSQSAERAHKANGEEACEIDPYRRRPPAKVIAHGCPRFVQDVPF